MLDAQELWKHFLLTNTHFHEKVGFVAKIKLVPQTTHHFRAIQALGVAESDFS